MFVVHIGPCCCPRLDILFRKLGGKFESALGKEPSQNNINTAVGAINTLIRSDWCNVGEE